MKTKILLVSLFVLLMVSCIGCASKKLSVEADVLSINSQLLEGRLIGQFLGSPDGYISNDVIKVGVSFTIKDTLFLRDLKLNHAELAYYKGRKTLPLDIKIRWVDIDSYKLEIRLNGRFVKSFYLSGKLGEDLVK